jgi:hypothetical protein
MNFLYFYVVDELFEVDAIEAFPSVIIPSFKNLK